MIGIVEVIAMIMCSVAMTGLLCLGLHIIKKSIGYAEVCELEKIVMPLFWCTGVSWVITIGAIVIGICQRLSS